MNRILGRELDEEDQKQIFGWLTTLLKLPYLDEEEKENAFILMKYMNTLNGTEPLRPLIRAVETKLKMKMPRGWEMELPDNYQISVNGEILSPDELRRRGITYIDSSIHKPIRDSTEWSAKRRLYADGHTEMLYEYQTFDYAPVAERHMFNVYGEKAVTQNIKKECMRNESNT